MPSFKSLRLLRFVSQTLLVAGFFALCALRAFGNDRIYPPAKAARGSIDFDGKGFIVQGQRTFITSGSIHYPRLPRAMWADILQRARRGGFNTVQTYAFWNYHEPHENEVDFTGEKDLGAFLDTAQKAGLSATVRVGPYVCAEWEFGGYPIWTKFKPDVTVRTDNPAFLALNDHWYGEVLPVILPHQIHRGGNLLFVQLENEHPDGWGVVNDRPYFRKIRAQALHYGLEVPYWFSGLNHDFNPAPENLSGTSRTSPWYTTEFWAGWFDSYRTLPAHRYPEIDAGTWTILAHGGAGYNYYMLYGGTNFETWNDKDLAASYDYASAIGQAGDLRPMYYRMKRQNQLALSFPEILANSTDALEQFTTYVTGAGLQVLGARRSEAGTLVFLQNIGETETTATFKTGETLKIPPHAVYPFPSDVKITDKVMLTSSTLPILGVARHGEGTTLVVYGVAGESGRIDLKTDAGISHLDVKIPDRTVGEYEAPHGAPPVRILAVSDPLSLRTWLIGDQGKQDVVIGPAYVNDLKEEGDHVSLRIERPYGEPSCGQVAVYGAPKQSWHLAAPSHPEADSLPAPDLSDWHTVTAAEADPAYDDSSWKQSKDPREMGSDGNTDAFAWYRAGIQVPHAGSGILHLEARDGWRVYVNGTYVPYLDGIAKVNFVAGRNVIAVLVWHNGRPKAFNYLDPIAHYEDRGLLGPVTVDLGGTPLSVTGWRMSGGLADSLAKITSWDGHRDGSDLPAFHHATFIVHLPAAVGAHPVLRAQFQGLERGTLWVNGHNLGQYPEKIPIAGLFIPECWLKEGTNDLVVFDVAGSDPRQVKLVVEKEASREVVTVHAPAEASTPLVTP